MTISGSGRIFFTNLAPAGFPKSTSGTALIKTSKRVKTIVNNSTTKSHIFLRRHSPLSILHLNMYSKILNSWIGFGSNRIVTNYSIQSEILNICTALMKLNETMHAHYKSSRQHKVSPLYFITFHDSFYTVPYFKFHMTTLTLDIKSVV